MAVPLRVLGSETWIYVCVMCLLITEYTPLAESFNWTGLPANTIEVLTGSDVSLTWRYNREEKEALTYIELTIEKGGVKSDIGDINAAGVITMYNPYKGYMDLTAANQSAILSIKGIEKEYDAKYCCKVRTSLEGKTKCIHLKVLESFNWTQLPPNITKAITGSAVNLTWSYDFGKDANLTFIEFTRRERYDIGSSHIGDIYPDGVVNVSEPYKGYVNLTAANQSATLNIKGIKTADDAKYCCKLKTTKGDAEKCVHLNVLDPPTVSVSSSPVIVVEGNHLSLICNTTGIPSPSIVWTKHAKPGKVLSNTSTLTLQNVQRPGNSDHTIKYQCTASNGVGSPANATVTVTVVVYPTQTTKAPSTQIDSTHSTTTENGLKDSHVIIIVVIATAVFLVLIGIIVYCAKKKHLLDRHRNVGQAPITSGEGTASETASHQSCAEGKETQDTDQTLSKLIKKDTE